MNRVFVVALLVLTAACGHHIGDACSISTDCAQDGSRQCDIYSPGGYCTIQGCDYGTCPDEAVCVRFFPALENATDCSTRGALDCAEDEVCTVNNKCAPHEIESRFCMLKCGSDGDCRDGYECRNLALMQKHGGEPVPDPNATTPTVPNEPFCASRRRCGTSDDCAMDEVCDIGHHDCVPR
jgi:hypothetical protein